MNKRVIVTGKAVLSTVMASSIACSMLATNIHAEELETPPEELATVEESTETSEVIEQPTTGDADVVEGEPAESIQPSTGEVITYATIDYSKLDSALKTVQDGLRDESMYTKDSWAQFKPVYDKALGAKSDASLTQEDVDQLAMDLIGAFTMLRIDPGAETDLDIIVTMEKTDHNTMIVNLDSYDLLQTPRGTPDGEINEKTWVYHFSNWRYVYQKEFTQNGTYNVSCTDVFGNTETITFTVSGLEVKNEAPVINATDKTITVGDKFDPRKDVTAIDKEDGDITNLMTIKSNVDTRKAGEYQVTYTVTDTQGATTTKTIKVTVKAKAEETNKDKDEKDKEKVNTAVGLSTGLFAGMTGLSALGMAVLKTLKKRDE